MKNSWPTKKLGELCEIKIGKTPRRGVVKYWTNGTLPWAKISEVGGIEIINTNEQITEIAVRELKMTPFPKGTILYTFKLSIGRVGIAGVDLFTNEAIAGLLIKDKKNLMPEWLFYVLPLINYKPFLSNAVKGNTLNKGSLNLLPITFPPLKIQKQIVERLDKIAGAQKLNDKLIQKSDELFQSLLHKELDPAGKEWKVKELEDVTLLVRGPFGGSLKKDIFVESGDCVYEQGNVIDGDLENFRYFVTPKKFEQMKRFEVLEGDILMSCSGTIGKFVIIPKNFRKGIINQALLKITPNQKVISEFLKFTLENYFSSNNTHVKGMAIKNIAAVKELKKIKIPTAPLEEQKQIVAKFSAVQEYKKQLFEQKTKLKELFDSVLHKSMKGEMD